ncbi:uncharacterized protein METZ01_LOCUS372228, partial [marine metagenome]
CMNLWKERRQNVMWTMLRRLLLMLPARWKRMGNSIWKTFSVPQKWWS